MAHKEHLQYLLQTNQGTLKKLIEDISEDESMIRGKDKRNHIRWQVGHLVYCDRYSLSLLNGKTDESDAYSKLFGAGSECAEDASVYPPFKQLCDELYAVHADLIAAAERVTDKDLEAMIGEKGKETQLWKTLTFMCMHEFYHAGQIVEMRRTIGRERPFG